MTPGRCWTWRLRYWRIDLSMVVRRRAARPCSVAGCPDLIFGQGHLCSRHQVNQRRCNDARRLSATQRGYDSNWQRIRKAHLKKHPTCVDCGNRATEVDHAIPLANGGTNDESNLRSRCKSCHSRKTARLDGGFGNAKRIIRGKGRQNR